MLMLWHSLVETLRDYYRHGRRKREFISNRYAAGILRAALVCADAPFARALIKPRASAAAPTPPQHAKDACR